MLPMIIVYIKNIFNLEKINHFKFYMCRQDLLFKMSLDCVPKDQRNNFNTEQEYYLVEHYPSPSQSPLPFPNKYECRWLYEFVMDDILRKIKRIE